MNNSFMIAIGLREAQSHRKKYILSRILVASLCFHNIAKEKEKKQHFFANNLRLNIVFLLLP